MPTTASGANRCDTYYIGRDESFTERNINPLQWSKNETNVTYQFVFPSLFVHSEASTGSLGLSLWSPKLLVGSRCLHATGSIWYDIKLINRVLILAIQQHLHHSSVSSPPSRYIDFNAACQCWKRHHNPSYHYRSQYTSLLIRHCHGFACDVGTLQVVSYKPNRRRWRWRDEEQSSLTTRVGNLVLLV